MIFKLNPILKHRLWGGNKLSNIFNVETNDKIGEAWLLSCIGNDNSKISNNKTLKEIFLENKDIVAKGYKGEFPILIKLIDANQDLSIQVHPQSKTEFWYVLNKKKSKLYLGLNKDSNRNEIKQSLKSSSITSLLNHIDVSLNDSYLIEPGTIHSIGNGAFIIEIQQSNDVTYRLYDFDRVDTNGQKRQLHINESLDCINYNKFDLKTTHTKSNHLISCPFFNVFKYSFNKNIQFNADEKSFNALIILNGKGEIKTNDEVIEFKQYDTIFVPAGTGSYQLIGKGEVILTTL